VAVFNRKFIRELLSSGDHVDSIAVYVEEYDNENIYYRKGKRVRKLKTKMPAPNTI